MFAQNPEVHIVRRSPGDKLVVEVLCLIAAAFILYAVYPGSIYSPQVAHVVGRVASLR